MVRVCCVGIASDPTFRDAVTSFAARGDEPTVIDLLQVSRDGDYRFDFSAPNTIEFRQARDTVIIAGDTPVYCRLLDVSAEAPTDSMRLRCRGLYWSVLRALGVRRLGPIVNLPLADRTNCSKLAHQRATAAAAARNGVAIVPSILTNQPDDARAFIAAHHGEVVSKGASAAKTIAAQVTTDDLAKLELARQCPILLQARIVGPDVRIHSVAGVCISELVVSDAVDYRFAPAQIRQRNAKMEVPSDIANFVRELHELFGVAFLGVDFKIDLRTLEWYFLEANSMPAYHGYDIRAEGRISDLLTRYLLDG